MNYIIIAISFSTSEKLQSQITNTAYLRQSREAFIMGYCNCLQYLNRFQIRQRLFYYICKGRLPNPKLIISTRMCI